MTSSHRRELLIPRNTQRSHASAMALLLALLWFFVGVSAWAQGQTLKILYSFSGLNPVSPIGSLVRDGAGNLYGITSFGGDFSGGCAETGCGMVFELDTAGTFTVLHTFAHNGDGENPTSLVGEGSNLLGTANTLFMVSDGKFTVFYPFLTSPDGIFPTSAIRDTQGNIYGTTATGGDVACNSAPYHDVGCGNVFMLDTSRNLTVLYNFTGPPDGNGPGGLIRDAAGNLYGMTGVGGNTNSACQFYAQPGCGVVFKVDSTGHETVLYSFTGGADGGYPPGFSGASLVVDTAGNLYGTTMWGGELSCSSNNKGMGCGVVFTVDTTGKETVLHTFTGQPDGAFPNAGMLRDAQGNLYGTTVIGGQFNQGTIFKLDSAGNLTVLHNFGATAADGQYPSTGLIHDAAGNLYGMTQYGGSNNGGGTIFEFMP